MNDEFIKKYPLSFIAYKEATKGEECVITGDEPLVYEFQVGGYLSWFLEKSGMNKLQQENAELKVYKEKWQEISGKANAIHCLKEAERLEKENAELKIELALLKEKEKDLYLPLCEQVGEFEIALEYYANRDSGGTAREALRKYRGE